MVEVNNLIAVNKNQQLYKFPIWELYVITS
jgi:hypothetical protein